MKYTITWSAPINKQITRDFDNLSEVRKYIYSKENKQYRKAKEICVYDDKGELITKIMFDFLIDIFSIPANSRKSRK